MTAGPFIVTHREGKHTTIRYPQPPLYREAFGTLVEARRRAMTAVWDAPGFASQARFRHALDDANQLNESGGSISLPDGSVIEAEATDYHELWKQVPVGRRGGAYFETEGAEILAAWNAEHGIGIQAAR